MQSTRNEKIYYVRYALYLCASMVTTSAVFQTFLGSRGITSEQFGIISSLSVLQTASTLIVSPLCDSIRNIKKGAAISTALLSVYLLILFCTLIVGAMTGESLFIVLSISGMLNYVLMGVYNALEYKLPYVIIDMSRYGRILSVGGIIGGVMQLLFSVLIALLSTSGEDAMVIGLMLAGGFLCMVGAAWLTVRFERVENAPPAGRTRSSLMDTLRLRPFRWLVVPDLCRGLSAGVATMLVVMALHEIGLTAAQSSLIMIMTTIIGSLGAFGFMKLIDRSSAGKTCLVGSLIYGAAIAMVFIHKSFIVFFVMYAVLRFGMTLVDYGVPVVVTEVVPYHCIGCYNSIRLGIYSGGTAISTALVGFAIGQVPTVVILLIAALLQVFSGWVYHRYRKMAGKIEN